MISILSWNTFTRNEELQSYFLFNIALYTRKQFIWFQSKDNLFKIRNI